jgi:thiamine phosphate synthase YjbQ (UPF0047 family)
MIEKLYCPDFSAIFDGQFANPFVYPAIDTLQWPLLLDLGLDAETKALLAVKDERNHELFYHRKLSSDSWKIERSCAGIGHALFQAFYFDEGHRITNIQALSQAQALEGFASAIICPELQEGDIAFLQENAGSVAGIVFFPLFQHIDLASAELADVLAFCDENRLPVKWDFYEHSVPKSTAFSQFLPGILGLFAKYPGLIMVMSGLDVSDMRVVIEKAKYYPRLWLEIDTRVLGGTSPAEFFKEVFALPGFVQNLWDRVVLGSATPMLEASQLFRGLWEATESLPFAQRCILRTWLPRNALRTFKLPLESIATDKAFNLIPRVSWVEGARVITLVQSATKQQVVLDYEVSLQSFSVTQLLWIQPLVNELWAGVKAEFHAIETGELMLRTYHTTTSMIMNEHERGNFLQLHYDLAERTRADPTAMLHTVAAEENRADFNFPDHILASSVGDRSLTIPISGSKLDIGSRENAYILVTFGPRKIQLKARFSFIAA